MFVKLNSKYEKRKVYPIDNHIVLFTSLERLQWAITFFCALNILTEYLSDGKRLRLKVAADERAIMIGVQPSHVIGM